MDTILAGIRSDGNRRPVARTQSGIARLMAKIGEWVDSFAPPVRGAAVAALLVLLAVQAGTIGALLRAPEGAGFRTASGETVTAATPSLLVMFAPEASAAEITTLLGTIDARIVDGPRAGGIYGLALAADADPEAALTALQERGDLVVFAAPGE